MCLGRAALWRSNRLLSWSPEFFFRLEMVEWWKRFKGVFLSTMEKALFKLYMIGLNFFSFLPPPPITPVSRGMCTNIHVCSTYVLSFCTDVHMHPPSSLFVSCVCIIALQCCPNPSLRNFQNRSQLIMKHQRWVPALRRSPVAGGIWNAHEKPAPFHIHTAKCSFVALLHHTRGGGGGGREEIGFGRNAVRSKRACDDYSSPPSGSTKKECSHFLAETEMKLCLVGTKEMLCRF